MTKGNQFGPIFRSEGQPPPLPEPNLVSPASADPQREAARAKREQRRERDREHHRESRGSTGRTSIRTTRSDRESSVPHESEYAISTKHQQQRHHQNRSRERPRQQRSQDNERPLSHHEHMTTDINLEPCKS